MPLRRGRCSARPSSFASGSSLEPSSSQAEFRREPISRRAILTRHLARSIVEIRASSGAARGCARPQAGSNPPAPDEDDPPKSETAPYPRQASDLQEGKGQTARRTRWTTQNSIRRNLWRSSASERPKIRSRSTKAATVPWRSNPSSSTFLALGEGEPQAAETATYEASAESARTTSHKAVRRRSPGGESDQGTRGPVRIRVKRKAPSAD